MKVFLDVGAHNGQTLNFVYKSGCNFERIICFEPSSKCIPQIKEIARDGTEINQFGFGKENKIIKLFMPGEVGASIYNDKKGINNQFWEEVRIISISEWVKRNLNKNDINIMKINVEGSEVDILEDLIHTKSIDYFYSILVHFDVRKIPSQKHREWETRAKIRKLKIKNVCYAEDVTKTRTEAEGIKYWFRLIGLFDNLNRNELETKYLKLLFSLSKSKSIKKYINYKYSEFKVYKTFVKYYYKLKKYSNNLGK